MEPPLLLSLYDLGRLVPEVVWTSVSWKTSQSGFLQDVVHLHKIFHMHFVGKVFYASSSIFCVLFELSLKDGVA
jgi:hypothetical protein